MTMHRRTFLTAALAGGATLAAGRSLAAAPDPMSKEAVLHDPQAPLLGNPKGDVTIVEWFDYQCPYCKQAYPDVMKIVRDDGQIRLVMKDWPIFGPPSEYAAQLTLAAGKYRPQALDALMRTPGRLTNPEIDATLKAAGFNIAALKSAYRRDQARIDEILTRNKTQAEGFGFFGTPAYIVGTVVFPGVPKMADFKQAIADARAKKSG
ncbi:DsbA family protein [Aurantimonas sp. VKM B-3413]|uniref:DsbA family protein n=1 Tax=Aurantimonas sp. VKM B-3413 TaxID=2779401 RepID=UPI001E56E397|nr:DsbA family protein [Aurantimonas sp. VKM B-3413]MCB8839904.1 DsbA family protein [Aurantimonas sp. VKM B-3413]